MECVDPLSLVSSLQSTCSLRQYWQVSGDQHHVAVSVGTSVSEHSPITLQHNSSQVLAQKTDYSQQCSGHKTFLKNLYAFFIDRMTDLQFKYFIWIESFFLLMTKLQ